MGASVYVAHLFHQCIETLSVARACGELLEPLAKSCIQCRALGSGDGACLLNQVCIGAESDIFHTKAVYVKLVYPHAAEKENSIDLADQAFQVFGFGEIEEDGVVLGCAPAFEKRDLAVSVDCC
jgi:hypothetical protein